MVIAVNGGSIDPRLRPTSAEQPRPQQPSTQPVAANDWSRFATGTQSTKAKITGFNSPLTDRSGFTQFRWSKPGDRIPLDLSVNLESGDVTKVIAEVWTNAGNNGDPEKFYAAPMGKPSRDGSQLRFHLDLPVDHVGNYRAVGRISTDGGQSWQWMSQSGISDLIFRTRAIEHEAINMREIHVGMANYDAGKNAPQFASLEDLTSGNGYTLEKLAAEGVNTIWLMSPFYTTRWEGSNPEDVAGSPFATRDYFSIDPRLSKAALAIPENEPERRREVALESFKQMVDKARSLGIDVVLDIALNHAGHDFIFRDLFETPRGLEVQKNNFSQIAVNSEQLGTIDRMLQDPQVEGYKKQFMEYLFPWAYASWDAKNNRPKPEGASSLAETTVGGWGFRDYLKWFDTKQWNHGANFIAGFVEAGSEQQNKVVDWYQRVLTFWSSVMGVAGFRLDHGQGLPNQFYERSLNKVQAAADQHRPGLNVFVMPEDHDRNVHTRHFTDAIQSGGKTGDLVWASQGHVDRLWEILNDPYFRQPIGSPSHDDARVGNSFGGDLPAAARYHALMQLLGGPYISLMGDEFAEGQKLLFKEFKGVPTLWLAQTGQLPAGNLEMSQTIARAGRAKVGEPALRTADRARLFTRSGQGAGAGGAIAGVARHGEGPNGQTVLVFANLDNHAQKDDVFRLDDKTRAKIDPNRRYTVRDVMAKDAGQARPWKEPMLGSRLLEEGVWVNLAPYQIAALALEPA